MSETEREITEEDVTEMERRCWAALDPGCEELTIVPGPGTMLALCSSWRAQREEIERLKNLLRCNAICPTCEYRKSTMYADTTPHSPTCPEGKEPDDV